jgi:hypothetical protein
MLLLSHAQRNVSRENKKAPHSGCSKIDTAGVLELEGGDLWIEYSSYSKNWNN